MKTVLNKLLNLCFVPYIKTFTTEMISAEKENDSTKKTKSEKELDTLLD